MSEDKKKEIKEEPMKDAKVEEKEETMKDSKKEPKKEANKEAKQEHKPENKKDASKSDKVAETEKKEVKKDGTEPKKEEKKTFEQPKKVKGKVEIKNKKEKKKSKSFTTAIVLILVLLIAGILTYMMINSTDPKQTVDAFLTNLKAGDFEKAQEFISGNQDLLNNQEIDNEVKPLLFDKLSWKITKIEKDADKATVEIEITNKDFKTVISKAMKNLVNDFKTVLSGGSVEQTIEKYFVEELKSEQVEMTTNTKTINLVKEDKKWKIESTDDLLTTLAPGLQEAINSLG